MSDDGQRYDGRSRGEYKCLKCQRWVKDTDVHDAICWDAGDD